MIALGYGKVQKQPGSFQNPFPYWSANKRHIPEDGPKTGRQQTYRPSAEEIGPQWQATRFWMCCSRSWLHLGYRRRLACPVKGRIHSYHISFAQELQPSNMQK
jgi:hypothetical protein